MRYIRLNHNADKVEIYKTVRQKLSEVYQNQDFNLWRGGGGGLDGSQPPLPPPPKKRNVYDKCIPLCKFVCFELENSKFPLHDIILSQNAKISCLTELKFSSRAENLNP